MDKIEYAVNFNIGDGKAEAPPYIVGVDDLPAVIDELFNDYGEPYSMGCKLTIERIW